MDELPTPPNPFLADGTSTALVVPSLLDVFYWPGDWAIYLLARYVPAVAEPLGLGAGAYGGNFAMFVSFFVWLLAALAAIMAWGSVRNFDRAVTRGFGGVFAEVQRRVRMALVLARYRREQRTRRAEPAIDVGELPALSREELRVLELHARVAPGFALAVSDVAEELRSRGYEIRGALERLQKLKLLQSTVGGLDGETAYTLTPTGRAALQQLRAMRR
jgi:DNA-binding MarR family transcriptional regulator